MSSTTAVPMRAKTRARRDEILRAARELLLEQGEIAIAALSKRSGASVGSLYHHFGSKDGVVQATAATVAVQYQTSLDDALRGVPMDLKRTVKEVVRHHLAFAARSPEPARLLSLLHVPPEVLLDSTRPRLDGLASQAADKREIDAIPSALLPALVLGPVMTVGPVDEAGASFLARAAWRSLRSARRT